MTDKFEEWLDERTSTSIKHRAREAIYLTEVLIKYREFLEEQAEAKRLERATEYAKTHGGFVWTPPRDK